MTDSTLTPRTLLPGTLVRDNNSRVGRVAGGPTVVELDGESVNVLPVEFWGELRRSPESFLTPVNESSPEALLWEQPEELRSWVEDAPLRLIALALSVGGGSGKMSDIRDKLSGRVLEDTQWDNWWKKHSRTVGTLPQHFESAKAPKGNHYRLLTSVDEVPADSTTPAKSKPVPVRVWRQWLLSEGPEEAPGRFPTKLVTEALSKWDDAETIDKVLIRLAVSAEAALYEGDISAQEAEGWLIAIAHAAIRRREIGRPDPRGYDAARAGEVLARLSLVAEDRAAPELLLRAWSLDGEIDAWRRGFAAGMWEVFDRGGARDLISKLSAVLGKRDRLALAREVAAAAFGPNYAERRHSVLDRLVDALPLSERHELIMELITSPVNGPQDRVGFLVYITESRYGANTSDTMERLKVLLMATLLLTNGRGPIPTRASQEFAKAMAAPDSYGPEVQAVFAEAARGIDQARFDARTEAQKQSQEAQAQLEQERQEQERLRQQVRERHAELIANREESRLELRQDMLLAVGEVLQSVCRSDDSRATENSVVAGLALALRAGGAEQLGTPGEVVEFNPEHHQAGTSVPERGLVKVVAPGVVYRGELHGDRVLLKAQVKHEAG